MKDEIVHYEAFTTYGQYEREEDLIAFSCCKN